MKRRAKKVVVHGLFDAVFYGGVTVIWNIECFKDGRSLLFGILWFYLTTKLVLSLRGLNVGTRCARSEQFGVPHP